MKVRLTRDDLRQIVERVYAVFVQNMDSLNDLDAKIGDGDHGLSMVTGFRAVAELVRAEPTLTLREMLVKGGQQFNEAAGSTIGILMFSAMREAGNAVSEERDTLGLAELALMMDAAVQAIMKRGKAEIGQKTILDSLSPAASALAQSLRTEGIGEKEAISAAIEAARAGAESTKEMISTIGRAKWFSGRTAGVVDPGAMSGYLIVKAFGEYFLERGAT